MITVDPKYKAYIFLDTNVLENYLEKSYPLLNKSIDFLSNIPFVFLFASHYVEYELTEVRKRRLFEYYVDGHYLDPGFRPSVKKNWIYKGKKYDDYKAKIKQQVIKEIDDLKNNHNIYFDYNVLHDGLILPVKALTLDSTISREDCMILTSAVLPNIDTFNLNSAIISSDAQFCNAVNKHHPIIDSIFNPLSAKTPILLHTRHIKESTFQSINLENNSVDTDIEPYFTKIIIDLIIEKNKKDFIGKSTKHKIRVGAIDNILYFKLRKENDGLRTSEGLVIIAKDLSFIKIFTIDANSYKYEGGAITLPFIGRVCNKYSVMLDNVKDDIQPLLNRNGNLIFYYDL